MCVDGPGRGRRGCDRSGLDGGFVRALATAAAMMITMPAARKVACASKLIYQQKYSYIRTSVTALPLVFIITEMHAHTSYSPESMPIECARGPRPCSHLQSKPLAPLSLSYDL